MIVIEGGLKQTGICMEGCVGVTNCPFKIAGNLKMDRGLKFISHSDHCIYPHL